MRVQRAVGAALLVTVVSLGAPAFGSTGGSLEWTTLAPCGVACPYWLDTANDDLDGDGELDIAFSACGNPGGTGGMLAGVPGLPFEEGVVYDDILVGPAPEDARLLLVEITPTVDWDLFICSEAGEHLAVCANVGSEECSTLGSNCDNALGPNHPVPVGCRERHAIPAVPGRRYILRAYNYSDPSPLQGIYCWGSSC